MSDFNVRSDSVDVEQIMEQIRTRIREKRGVDYTEQQIRELAAVKLEKLVDPRVRSDLVEQFKRRQPVVHDPLILPPLSPLEPRFQAQYEPAYTPGHPPEDWLYTFEQETIYETHRGALRFVRRLLNPLLKLFFNPNPIIQALHRQGNLNRLFVERDRQIVDRDKQVVERDKEIIQRDKDIVNQHNMMLQRDRLIVERDNIRELQRVERREMDALYYEVIHNLVFELTRLGIENKNLQMRMESMVSRLEFNERRARALESVVTYRPAPEDDAAREVVRPSTQPTERFLERSEQPRPGPAGQPGSSGADQRGAAGLEGPGQRSRRRRRRRGRRGGASAVALMAGGSANHTSGPGQTEATSSDVIPSSDALGEPAGGGSGPQAETAPAAEPTGSDPKTDSQ